MKREQIPIKAADAQLVPTYTNSIQLTHSGEEFVLDLFAVYPPQGVLLHRIVISPQHALRLRDALKENIERYEAQYGAIVSKGVPFDLSSINIGDNNGQGSV